MPSWQPIWSDVRFDHAKAREAIDQLTRCAALLDHQTDRRVALARTAQHDWLGRARQTFDDELERMTRQAVWLIDALRSLARSIGDAGDAARLEQRRREAERARWWDDKRTEDARCAEQGLPPSPGPRRSAPSRAF